MTRFKKTILAVLLSTIWISISEFIRNEFLLKQYWSDHYWEMGLEFPSAPINGIMWGVWSLLLAILIFQLLRKFSLLQGILIAWLAAFLMMWVVIGNLDVLPYPILYYAVPLSLIEVYVAAVITRKMARPKTDS